MEKIYTSTRSHNIKVSSKQAILEGLSKDGGLYVYDDIDKIHIDLDKIIKSSYKENAYDILSKLLPDYTKEELIDSISNAYSHFPDEEVTPVKKVGNIFVLELFKGPTSAFKDVALCLLPWLMSKALKDSNKKALILTATSGDTGKAALNGFKDVENTKICVFYPHNKVSAIQYKQMACQLGSNVYVYAVEGNFDDAQSGVKKIFTDEKVNDLANKHNLLLTSANSINIGRLVPQIVYYFESYKYLVNNNFIKLGDKVSFSVPTGNFGDVLAGYYAYLMGLPVKYFYVASDENNVLTDFINTGIYDRNREFKQTISPSMDILISSNLERLLYYLSDKDDKYISSLMNDLATSGRYQISEKMLKKLQSLFKADYVTQSETKEEIKQVFEESHYLLDTHSAIGYKVARKERDIIVALATASPYKFSIDVLASLGYKESDEFKAMEKLSEVSTRPIPTNLASLNNAEILHKDVISKEDMLKTVEKIING